ncbi:MAG: hypothetical protein HC806_06860, partial [Anaerolineae bacterium]|nr:hypothetical protein [Anaerolineae bacterium]
NAETRAGTVNVSPDSVTQPIPLRLPILSPGHYHLALSLINPDRSHLAENFYNFTVQ